MGVRRREILGMKGITERNNFFYFWRESGNLIGESFIDVCFVEFALQ